ncbi:hypothetical protein LMG28688_06954 [Paraburkholderia caffeinitolerans]|uniref:Uncharacterized protein n=2 Tax=Burkholderiaceae TaxID=119060 RepID=A0A6J5GYH3_9BURK|nr:hypothetical protein [Paraburkholderia caffeinitolerans]CAB3809288.1 hypothetical protein LMG28688_06954 [Paraburkholderia caffeinitolerans]
MAKDELMGFGITGNTMFNSMDSVGLKGNRFLAVFRGQTMGERPFLTGIGVFEGDISDEDRSTMRNMRNVVCAMKDVPNLRPGNPGFFSASVTCQDGREVNLTMDTPSIPQDVGYAVLTPTRELITKFYKTGTPVAKLDVSAEFTQKDGKLIVIFKFKNSGNSEIAFSSPTTWEGVFNPISKSSNISIGGGLVNDDDHDFSLMLGARQFLNASDYPGDVVKIPPGQVRYLKFAGYPNNRISKGRNEIGGTVSIGKILGPELLKGAAEFRIANFKVDFPEDYPANDEQLHQLEAYRRELLRDKGMPPGVPVEETGYYRAYGDYDESASRGDDAQLLRKGEKFPERALLRSVGGHSLESGPVKTWRWNAYPDSKLRGNTGQYGKPEAGK